VQMIFSDKTGTLTMNKMEFKKCSVRGGQKYGDLKTGEEDVFGGMCESEKRKVRNRISEGDLSTTKFFKALALCHTVVCEDKTD
jgi:magnesium-transporting ATPase (P-type)